MGPLSLSVCWKDEPEVLVEVYPNRTAASIRTTQLTGMPYDERPEWELADAEGNVLESYP